MPQASLHTVPLIVTPSLSMRFNAQEWNAPDIVRGTNCYTYALNAPQLGPRNIGCAANTDRAWELMLSADFGDVDCLRQLARDDGLLPMERLSQFNPARNHVIAVFGGRYRDETEDGFHTDFHCMRMDGDGTWSEKPGDDPAINRGGRNEVLKIGRLQRHFINSSRAVGEDIIESIFAGYFRVPESGMTFEPKRASEPIVITLLPAVRSNP
jgi:hypothetical protein